MANFSKNDQRPIDFVWDWYENQKQALFDYRKKLFDLFSNQSDDLNEKFWGLTTNEFNSYFEKNKEELEHLVCFDLITSVEAMLKTDFNNRIKKKRKNCLVTEKFRKINRAKKKNKNKKINLSLEQDIISVWKEALTDNEPFSKFLGLLNYRHWLAHGRYWTPNIGQNYDPEITYDISEKIFQIVNKN